MLEHRDGPRSPRRPGARDVRILVIAVCATALALVPASALAQSNSDLPGMQPPSVAPVPGLETAVMSGVGGLSDFSGRAFTTRSENTDAQFAPGPAIQLLWGYHLTHWLSMGLHLAYSYHPATVLPAAATTGHADILMAGGYVRLFVGTLFKWRRFEPTVTLGFDPAAGLWQAYQRDNVAVLTTVSGGAAWAGIGASINITQRFAVGVDTQAAYVIPYSRCGTIATTEIVVCPNEPLVANSYFFAGISARFTLY